MLLYFYCQLIKSALKEKRNCVHSLYLNHDKVSNLRFTHLLRTISIGTPGFTIAIFIHSLPRSMDMTATETANAKTRDIKLVRQTDNTDNPVVQQISITDISLAVL